MIEVNFNLILFVYITTKLQMFIFNIIVVIGQKSLERVGLESILDYVTQALNPRTGRLNTILKNFVILIEVILTHK